MSHPNPWPWTFWEVQPGEDLGCLVLLAVRTNLRDAVKSHLTVLPLHLASGRNSAHPRAGVASGARFGVQLHHFIGLHLRYCLPFTTRLLPVKLDGSKAQPGLLEV